MSWVFLSPHFDDAALSCGGLIWEQVRAHQSVEIWTICAAEPPAGDLSPFAHELHTRWQIGNDAPAQRKKEDILSCNRLGAGYRYFSIPDCIYRRQTGTSQFMYTTEPSLNGPLHPGDAHLVRALSHELESSLQPGTVLVCPMALGNHVDHQLTRQAAEALTLVDWYYADFPYVLTVKDRLAKLEQAGWISQVFPISPPGLAAWHDSISAHSSQISTFWADDSAMRQAVTGYLHWYQGIRLWRKPVA